MKTYYLTLSQKFPAKHPRKGEPTKFKEQLINAIFGNKGWDIQSAYPNTGTKLHTIRANYPLWKKRFEKIEKGEACLSIRQWSGKPYASKQVEIACLTKEDGIGIQKMEFLGYQEGYRKDAGIWIAGRVISYDERERIAINDGLTLEDWDAWFAKYDKTQPLAIIHFTSFRY